MRCRILRWVWSTWSIEIYRRGSGHVRTLRHVFATLKLSLAEVQLQYVGFVRVNKFLVRGVLGAIKRLLKATGTPRGLVMGRLFIAHNCKLLSIWNRRPERIYTSDQ